MNRSQLLPFLSAALPMRNPTSEESRRKYSHDGPCRVSFSTFEKMENFFIDALLTACTCQQHTFAPSIRPPVNRPPFIYHKARRRNAQSFFKSTRSMHTLPKKPQPLAPSRAFTRDDYLRMLDYYQEPAPVQDIKNDLNMPTLALTHPPADVGRVRDEDVTTQAPDMNPSSQKVAIERLVSTLNVEDCSHETIVEAYSALPFPGVTYLSPWTRRLLLRRLSTTERKNTAGLVRYLAVVDDMKAANLQMTEAEWNSILAFTGRCFSPVRTADVESALQVWKDMEQSSQVQSGEVTFNILFDIAAKAGKFVLAEMILKEMRARNLPMNRLARTGIIFYHGLQGDGEAVRLAYKDFVEAGEIVDTVVMNCVIASLIRAGEPQAAEFVYERMKRMHLATPGGLPPSHYHWRHSRDLGRILDKAARNLRAGSEQHRKLQNEQLLCPDLRTYAIFIEYHVSQTGELLRIVALLEDMQALGVPVHGRIFVKLLKGFATHGGVRYTSWTGSRLEKVWASLLAVLDCPHDEGASDDVHVGKWMVVWAVRAFDQCSGRRRAIDIWAELRSKWKPGPDEEMAVLTLLGNILREHQSKPSGEGGEGGVGGC